MLVSDKLGFIFHHVPKTGGMSMRAALVAIDNSGWVDFPTKHPHSECLKRIVGEYRWDNYYKFAFVRNPWDWYVSFYNFILQNPQWLVWDNAWKQFDHEEFEAYRKHFMEEGFDYWLENFNWSFYSPYEDVSFTKLSQLDWLTVEHDKIFKLEEIEQASNEIGKVLGRTITMPIINESKRDHYSKYYTQKSRDYVGDLNSKLITEYDYGY